MAETVEFYQIYYKEDQKSILYPWSIPYFNDGLTVFFENSIIKELVSKSKADRISVCSHRLREKLRLNVFKTRTLTEDVLYSDYDVLSFTRNSRHHLMLAFAEVSHPGFKETTTKILDAVGFKMPTEVKNPIYQNHFIAKSEIYKEYISELLSPAMDVMINDKEINELCMKDSRYISLADRSGKNIKKKLGIDYYPMFPFLLERFFSIWCDIRKIKIDYL